MERTRCMLGAWALGFLCSARSATAQAPVLPSVNLQGELVTHSEPHGNRLVSQLNAADCLHDDVVRFPLTLSGSRGYSLEAWAGFGCEEKSVRSSTDHRPCWSLASVAARDGAQSLELRAKDILLGITAAGDPLGPHDPAGACEDSSATAAAQRLTIYFMLVDSAHNLGALATWVPTVKLRAPPPPDRIVAGIGQGSLVLSFGYNSASADQTINGFRIYCDPAPGEPSSGASAGVDPVACLPSALLVAGAESSLLSAQLCGSAGRTASTATVGPLSAGIAYDLAVTAVDTYENESVLSPVVCQVPSEKAEPPAQTSTACAFSRHRQTPPLFVLLSLASFLVARRRTSLSRARLGFRSYER